MAQQIGNSELLRTWANDGTVVVPADAKIDEGWLRGEQPPHEWMNYIHNVLGQKINHALSRGSADWNSETEYLAGAIVNHNDELWLALATNTNSTPSEANANWSGLYSRNNILGTVSQSGGVPTGAVIEHDSNANGEYVRFADGTQICYRFENPTNLSIGAGQTGSIGNYNFPINFVGNSAKFVSGFIYTGEFANLFGIFDMVRLAGEQSWGPRVKNTSGVTATGAVLYLLAVGRWH